MKQKLSLTLGIIVLLIIGLATSPAKAVNPTLQSILDAIAALQNSVNSQSTAIGTLQDSVNNLEPFQGNMPPAWYQILPSAERFLPVMDGVAVLDRETGLVWEKSPSTSTLTWFAAQTHCNDLTVGNRKGWRLPTIQELASLIDPSVASPGPTLPSGHPFSMQSATYWSATTRERDPRDAWGVDFKWFGLVGVVGKSYDDIVLVWCVRGGQGVDPQ
jgi:hypothetical protein